MSADPTQDLSQPRLLDLARQGEVTGKVALEYAQNPADLEARL